MRCKVRKDPSPSPARRSPRRTSPDWRRWCGSAFPSSRRYRSCSRITATARHPGASDRRPCRCRCNQRRRSVDVGYQAWSGDDSLQRPTNTAAGDDTGPRSPTDHDCGAGGRWSAAGTGIRSAGRQGDETPMRNPIRLKFSTGHTVVLAVLAPLAVLLFMNTRYWWAGIALAAAGAIVAFVTFFGRRITGWVGTVFVWLRRRRKPPDVPSEPEVGATVKPGDHVAVRWRRDNLIAVIELKPRPFTPTVIVDGKAHTDDVLDTRLLEQLLEVHCPDLEADIVSAGFRVGQNRLARGGECLSAGDRRRPGPGEPQDLDHAAGGPETHPQVGAASCRRRRGSGPVPGGLGDSHRRQSGQPRRRCGVRAQLRRLRPRHRYRVRP